MEKYDENKKKAVVGAVGAITGVVVGIAAAIMLSKKENQKKVGKVLQELKNKGKVFTQQVVQTVGELSKEAQNKKKQLKRRTDSIKGNVTKAPIRGKKTT